MKTRSVNPGVVYIDDEEGDYSGFKYTINVDNGTGPRIVWCSGKHPSAAAAKQAMREKVAHERKKHGLLITC